MNTTRLLTLAAVAAIALAACTPRPKITTQQVQSVTGLGMADVEAKIGRATSVTNAGDSIWWEYINVTTPNGNDDGACHIVFRKGIAVEVKC